MRETFETNVFGTVRVTGAFLPLLQRSAAPVIVNRSSGLASPARVTDAGTPTYAYPGVAYPTSRTAVNMITVQYAKAFRTCGSTRSSPASPSPDLNGNTGIQTVEQGAEIIVRMAQGGPRRPHRRLLRRRRPPALVGGGATRWRKPAWSARAHAGPARPQSSADTASDRECYIRGYPLLGTSAHLIKRR